MRLEVCQPDEVTFSLMIHACAKVSIDYNPYYKKYIYNIIDAVI